MISLRQHVTSLVAVFLALAVGVVLGGGPLAGGDDDPAQTPSARQATTPDPAGDDGAGFADRFAAEAAGPLYADGLNGHAAAILAMPGTPAATVKALQAQIVLAGGAITGTYTTRDGLVDPEGQDEVDEVGASLVTQLADPRIDPTATTYPRMGALLALAIATTQVSSVRADLAAVTIREALGSAGLLESPADVRNAPLVLVLLAPGADRPPSSLAIRTVVSGLVSGLATNTAGVVVAADADSADDGELAALRESDLVGPVSTVDGIDSAVGQVTTILAMIAAVAGVHGSYGASGADGVVPLG